MVAYRRNHQGTPLFLPVLPPPDFDPRTEQQQLECWFDRMYDEGGIAAQVLEGNTIVAAREFPLHNEPRPIVYMVTHPRFTETGITGTLSEIRDRFPNFNGTFAATGNGVMAIDMDGPIYIGLPLSAYREQATRTDDPGAPVCFPGYYIPCDGTYIEVGRYHRAYIRTSNEVGGFRVVEYWRHVVPYIGHLPLWTIWGIDRFGLLGERIAMESAQNAIALARYGFEYSEIEHYQAVALKIAKNGGLPPFAGLVT